MTANMRDSNKLQDLFKPLPELDGNAFTLSVMVRTKRIQHRRSLLGLLTWLSVAAVTVAALPWPFLLEFVDSISRAFTSNALSSPAEPMFQITTLTEWLQIAISLEHMQTPQLVMIAALTCIIAGVISFVMTEV